MPANADDGEDAAKLITDRRGKILGACIAGPEAGEIIGIFALALAQNLSIADLAAFIDS